MKALHLLAMSAAMAALPILAAAQADAQQRPVSGGLRITPPSHGGGMQGGGKHGFHGGFGGVFIVEREVPVIVERETPPPPAAVPLPEQAQGGAKAPPRKPYVIGNTYASLPPEGCMKMIDDGVSYYYCDGEWYRQMSGDRDAQFKAVARP